MGAIPPQDKDQFWQRFKVNTWSTLFSFHYCVC